jgi:lipid-A-disaccharide synthase
MAAEGVFLHQDSTLWGLVGYADAAGQLRSFLRRLDAAVARLRADPPDVLVPIDFPGFNLALLKRLRGLTRAVYYVPPMVSIRRGRRAARVAALGARLLAIFPFEAEAYRRAGADVVFVGHPSVDLLERTEPPERVRMSLRIGPSEPVLGLLPGSRQHEIDALLEPMLESAATVRAAIPTLEVLLALSSPVFRDRVDAAVAASGLRAAVLEGAREVMGASTVLLTASGTATVEAMVLGVPMVVTYRTAWANWLLSYMVVNYRRAALPNIMARSDVVPELLQSRATPAGLARAVIRLLRDPAAAEAMRLRLLELAGTLGPPGAARRAACEVLAAAGRQRRQP